MSSACIFCILGAMLLLYAVVNWMDNSKVDRNNHPRDSGNWKPAGPGQAEFLAEKPTWNSGMQWDINWRLANVNRGAFAFDTEMDQGLMVGLSSAMSDTG